MDTQLLKKLAQKLKSFPLEKKTKIMEVCGTHTVAFFRSGIKDFFPSNLILVDGPGCPVCVTPNEYLDRAITIAKKYNVILTTFGDMIKVPSSSSSLRKEMTVGLDVRMVYSPLECLHIAKNNPEKEVIFLSVGFETTAPTEAATLIEAKEKNINNFSILAGNKLTPPAVAALLDSEDVELDGFILPGHVSAILGTKSWEFIANKYNRPGVIAGFETHELLIGMLSLLEMIKNNKNNIDNGYPAVVKYEGNKHAVDILYKVYENTDSVWRGIGVIPGSGLKLTDNYSEFDAEKKFPVDVPPAKEAKGCRCGELLRGLISPLDCPLFGKACVPEEPIGPCMVSSEGPCAAYYKYRR